MAPQKMAGKQFAERNFAAESSSRNELGARTKCLKNRKGHKTLHKLECLGRGSSVPSWSISIDVGLNPDRGIKW